MLQKIYAKYGHSFFIVLFLTFFFLVQSEQLEVLNLHVPLLLYKDKKYFKECVQGYFFDTIHINKISFQSDSQMSVKELLYITDLSENQDISSDDIVRALYFLAKKNSFESATISLFEYENGFSLHFYLQSAWTLSKIKIHGVLRGAQEYKRLYELELSDQFDRIKHERSCEKIRNHLIREGYHDVIIKDDYKGNAKTKTIEVIISITRGKRYRISDTTLEIKNIENINKSLFSLERDLQKRFSRELNGAWYSYEDIAQVAAGCKKYILRAGFLSGDISLVETFNRRKKRVKLSFIVDVSSQKQFFFEGNNFFTQADLIDQFAQFGKSIWLLPTELLSEEIEQLYQNKGFWDVSVVNRQDDVSVVFTIHEGKRARIDHVRLTNQKLEEEQKTLKKFFREVVHGYIDDQKIQSILYNFVAQYVDQGYISAKIINHTYERIEDNKYILTVAFDKGKQARVDKVLVVGLNTQESGLFFSVEQEQPLTRDFILHQRSQLIEHCKDLGYLYAEVNPQVIVDDQDKVLLQWNVLTGPKVFFGKTIVVGRPQFSFEKIMKRICYKDGQLWDYALVQRSLEQFKKINVFDVVQLYPDQTYTGQDQLLLLRLQHDDPFELRLRTGFELEHIKNYQTFGGVTYKVGSTLMVKNPLKVGDIFRFDADISGRHQEVTVDYTVPIDMGGVSTLKTQVYHILFEHPGFIGCKKNIYTVYQNGFLCGLQKKVGYADFGYNIGVEWQKTEINDKIRADILADAIGFDKNTLNKQVPYVFFEPTLYIDVLDNNLSPNKGLYALFSLKGMVPLKERGATELFLKFHAEQAFFIPLHIAVLAARLRFGHIFYHDFSGINPIERFYLGGSHSVRGYETDLVAPLKEFIEDDGDVCLIPRGGKSMLNANVEMRFNLFENIGAVLFHDVGTLSNAQFKEQDSFIAHASGFGVRFHTPLGPLRFDMGFKWNRLFEQERWYAWYVTFGHAF